MPEEVNIQVFKRSQILLREHPSWWYCSLIAVLLVAIVVHFGVRYRHVPPLAGFIIIFISLLPLAYQVSEATDRLGDAIRSSIVAVLISIFLRWVQYPGPCGSDTELNLVTPSNLPSVLSLFRRKRMASPHKASLAAPSRTSFSVCPALACSTVCIRRT